MSADGRSADADARAADLESASFVRLVARADGDALAASGLVARALADRGTPFQVTVGRTIADRTARAEVAAGDERDLTLVIGAADVDADAPATVTRLDADDRPATLAAVDHVRELGATPDLALALAGLAAAGLEPGAGESEWVLETAQERGLVERRPGLAVPTADPVDGVAHSTRLRGPWSGDADAARDALADAVDLDAPLEADAHRTIGSLVALEAVSADAAGEVAAESVQRALRPYATPGADAPFETVGGYADVLEATARAEPGTGAALAMGHEAREQALSAWREYGRRTHRALEAASTGRYDGLYVVGVDDGPVEGVARVAAAYRSPEPTVLVVGDGEAALATRDDESLGPAVEGVARELACETEYDVGRQRGYLRYDPDGDANADIDESTIIATVRELL
ncbi:exonuclease [Halopiger thermotolerans]